MARSVTLARVQESVANLMDRIREHFKPDAKVSVLVRRPGLPERDFLMTNDIVPEIIAALLRRQAVGPQGPGETAATRASEIESDHPELVLSQINQDLRAQLDKANAERDHAVEVLGFYADPPHQSEDGVMDVPDFYDEMDFGARAQKCIDSIKGAPND